MDVTSSPLPARPGATQPTANANNGKNVPSEDPRKQADLALPSPFLLLRSGLDRAGDEPRRLSRSSACRMLNHAPRRKRYPTTPQVPPPATPARLRRGGEGGHGGRGASQLAAGRLGALEAHGLVTSAALHGVKDPRNREHPLRQTSSRSRRTRKSCGKISGIMLQEAICGQVGCLRGSALQSGSLRCGAAGAEVRSGSLLHNFGRRSQLDWYRARPARHSQKRPRRGIPCWKQLCWSKSEPRAPISGKKCERPPLRTFGQQAWPVNTDGRVEARPTSDPTSPILFGSTRMSDEIGPTSAEVDKIWSNPDQDWPKSDQCRTKSPESGRIWAEHK